jgi:hypothetical protein
MQSDHLQSLTEDETTRSTTRPVCLPQQRYLSRPCATARRRAGAAHGVARQRPGYGGRG